MSAVAKIVLFAPAILAALTVHEYAHGLVAWRLGDPTAKRLGRLTLNPLAHLDPIGTLMLFIFYIGWAKPVPVNPAYFHNPRRYMVWVALAGPGANIILALILGILLQFLLSAGLIVPFGISYTMLGFTIFINLMLAFFNLIPIPPLDGSRVVGGLLPPQYLRGWEAFERVGWVVLIGIILLGRVTGLHLFGSTIFPLSNAFYRIFTGGAPLFF